MDPVSKSLENFQKQFRKFRLNPKKRILCILSSPAHIGQLSKIMRAEEWQPDNKSPFIILHTESIGNPDREAADMCRLISDHFDLLKKSFEEDGITLPPLQIEPADNKIAIDPVIEYITAFDKSLKGYLEPSYFCWLPTNIKNIGMWKKSVRWFYDFLLHKGNRIVLASNKEKVFDHLFDDVLDQVDTIIYDIDQEASSDYFAKLFAPPSKGHIKGTPSGSAAPDVAPPPRKVMAPVLNPQDNPYPDQLTPEQAEQLRTYVITAAVASGKFDEQRTLENQLAACKLCEDAHVHLEHALMRLTLGNYFVQFKRREEALEQYILAETVASKINAFIELAQIRLAKAGIYMAKKKTRIDAIEHYEQAAAAAIIGGSNLLYLEALRMAGTIHLENAKDKESAFLCWKAALKKCEGLSVEELSLTSLPDIACLLYTSDAADE
jgi:tetratricopeptide (TPR) repeat protein